jgi:hypothetical protein
MDTLTHHTNCRHISGTGWACVPECGDRPVVAMAGRVTAAFATGNVMEIWCQSPTGGESDSQIFYMKCNTAAQAEFIASQWQIRWGI